MPELPEVETIVRTVGPRLEGRRIIDARFYSALVLRGHAAEAAAAVRGRAIKRVRRHGKFIVLELSGGTALTIHLGMTGRLLWDGTPGPYTRAEFVLDCGRLLYDDIRQFGRIEAGRTVPARVAGLGPDPLDITAEEFAQRLRGHRGAVKPLLLQQRFIRGLGNIYVDEALFRARIHPHAAAARLGRARIRRLYESIQEVLRAAIESGGSSISDYVDADGRRGAFQQHHRVYGRAGLPCVACGSPIRRIVIAQRGTHYCPRCQRA